MLREIDDQNLPRLVKSGLLATGIAAIAFIFGLSFIIARATDELAAKDTRKLAETVVAGWQERTEVSVYDYSFWDEAYYMLIERDDEAVFDNLGTGAYGGSTFDIIVYLDRSRQPIYGWTSNVGPQSDTGVLPARLAADVVGRLGDELLEPYGTIAFFEVIDGQPTVFAAGLVRTSEIDSTAAADYPVMVGGNWITLERLAQAAVTMNVGEITVATPDSTLNPDEDSLVLANHEGEPAFMFVWQKPTPGTTVFVNTLPFMIVFSVALLAAVSFAATATSRLAASVVREREEAQKAAEVDTLTQVFSRFGIARECQKSAVMRDISAGRAALLFLDLNGFKHLNDTIGHDGGDTALVIFAERIRGALRGTDKVGRFGGDEFVVLLRGENIETTATRIAERIVDQSAVPTKINEELYFLRPSIGIAVSEAHDSWELLVSKADAAMYAAKESPGEAIVVYTRDLSNRYERQRKVEHRLRAGLEAAQNGESPFSLAFQPIIDAESGSICYAEVLVRWEDEVLGSITPGEFIPIAEARGLIVEVGKFVLEETCRVLREHAELCVSVNVSSLQLIDQNFPEFCMDTVLSNHIDPKRVILEITETALVEVPDTAQRQIETLRAAGFRFALDDFGTGYASISYLKQFPFNTLKIDKSYVDDLGSDQQADSLFEVLVALGKSFDLAVVAEGVETEEQRRIISKNHCWLHQGYLYNRPLRLDELIENYFPEGGEQQTA